jgi:hypothetical protein
MNFPVVKAAARRHERQHVVEERLPIHVVPPRSHPVDNRIDSLRLFDSKMANHQTKHRSRFQVPTVCPAREAASVTEREVNWKHLFFDANRISMRTSPLQISATNRRTDAESANIHPLIWTELGLPREVRCQTDRNP